MNKAMIIDIALRKTQSFGKRNGESANKVSMVSVEESFILGTFKFSTRRLRGGEWMNIVHVAVKFHFIFKTLCGF